MLAAQVPPSGVVHKNVGSDQGMFLITEVLDVWEGYDSDVHCPGSYVAWNLGLVEREKGEEEVKSTRKKKVWVVSSMLRIS